MKERLSALDGLRGLAAFSVFLAHTGFNISAVTTIPILALIFSIFSDGTNAVQILFVLSGFLMAYLYEDLTHAAGFIRKRYTRIFPLYIVIVLYLWIVNLEYIGTVWYQQIIVLLLVALSFHFLWRLLRKTDQSGRWRALVFWGFIGIQLLAIVVNLIATSHFTNFGRTIFPNQLIGLSNLTLTTNFINNMPRLSSVFWSLVPEIIFYILFPFLVIPLIKVSKKWGPLVSILIVIGMTKIIFDLDVAFYSYSGFQSMNIARACGFIAGVVMATIFKSQGKVWQTLTSVFKHSWAGVIIFFVFLWTQWAVGQAIENGQGVATLNLYYLLSSWVIALLIVAVIMPKTIMNKVFSFKLMIFLGLISYSIYLIHTSLIDVANKITVLIKPYVASPAVTALFSLTVSLLLTIVISYILFKLVESIYFADKKLKPKEQHSSAKQAPKVVHHNHSIRNIYMGGILFAIIIIIIYAGTYSSSLTISRHSFQNANVPTNSEISLLGKTVDVPFTATDQNLSEVVILFRYYKSAGYTAGSIKHPAQLVFHLYDGDTKKLLFKSQRSAFETEGQLRFPFGFTTQADSKNKHYIVELSMENASAIDHVLVNTSPTSLVAVYTNPNTSKVQVLSKFVMNRFIFAITNPDAQFALLFLIFIIVLLLVNPSHLHLKSKT